MKIIIATIMLVCFGLSSCQKCEEVCGHCYEVNINEKKLNGDIDADTTLLGRFCDKEYCDLNRKSNEESFDVSGMKEYFCIPE
ncbi:MAG: hypothetical protein KDC92_07750 [Bacteroidetes bacterium]|nr:hypothetical protein [Bacteroidota bacterium]